MDFMDYKKIGRHAKILLLFTGRYFRYRKYRMKVYRVQFWAIFMRSIAQNGYSSHTCEL